LPAGSRCAHRRPYIGAFSISHDRSLA
jgi:hypothetical protein